jgi:TRAP-type C4-dicarboxylate transport system permease small subunit
VEKLFRFEKAITIFFEILITVLFFIVLCTTNILVILRYAFNSSIIGGSEAMNFLFIYTTGLGAAVSVGKESHISITFFVDKVHGVAKKNINIIKYIVIGIVNGAMLWYSLPWIRSAGVFVAPELQIPMWIVQIVVPLGCLLAMVYCSIHIIRQCIR